MKGIRNMRLAKNEEVLAWAKAQDKIMGRGKAKLTNDETVAIVKKNRIQTDKEIVKTIKKSEKGKAIK
jgi:hypothetical protein